MNRRTVSTVAYAAIHNMGDMQVRQPLPSSGIEYADPFVLLHHFDVDFPHDGEHAGLGAHPHRGFSPVTFLFDGAIQHHDSRGNQASVDAWGTQWLHAGSGILHDEHPFGSHMEGIQLWINSPARHKMDEPSYHPLLSAETPTIATEDGALIRVIAGDVDELHGPVPTLTPITAATLEIPAGAKLTLPAPGNHTALLYLLDGAVTFEDGTGADGFHLIVFKNDGDTIAFQAEVPTRALYLTGEPLNEPIVTYGPFVMNSDEEIRQAYRDYISGKMGVVEGPAIQKA